MRREAEPTTIASTDAHHPQGDLTTHDTGHSLAPALVWDMDNLLALKPR